jgi:hypothetical protein
MMKKREKIIIWKHKNWKEFKERSKRVQREFKERSKRVQREFKESSKRVQREYKESSKTNMKLPDLRCR